MYLREVRDGEGVEPFWKIPKKAATLTHSPIFGIFVGRWKMGN